MEPSSLKDYLETLLSERNDRLMGGVIKHFGSDLCPSDLCYKEVMPANNTPQPAETQPGSCPNTASQQPAKSTSAYQSCTAEAYQNYALNALKNLANILTPAEANNAAKSSNCTETAQAPACANQSTALLPEKLAVNTPSPAAQCQTTPTYLQPSSSGVGGCQNAEVMQVNLLISQQLERIEHMIREMYITNQELFKSIITYCREHADS